MAFLFENGVGLIVRRDAHGVKPAKIFASTLS